MRRRSCNRDEQGLITSTRSLVKLIDENTAIGRSVSYSDVVTDVVPRFEPISTY